MPPLFRAEHGPDSPVVWLRAERAWPALGMRAAVLAPSAYGFLVVAVVAGHQGGFFPSAWAWTALATWWVAAIALTLEHRSAFGVLDVAMVGGLLAFAGWFAASAWWSASVPATLDETVRYVAYAGLVSGGVLVVKRRTAPALLGGVAAGLAVIAVYALAARLLEGPGGVPTSDRLSGPVTYYNGLGLAAAMAILLMLGFALRAGRMPVRAAAAALLPPLAVTAYFTFSRGAAVALALGLLTAIALDHRRLELVLSAALLAAAPAAAVLVAARLQASADAEATVAMAARERHELALAVTLLAAAGAALAVAAGRIEQRVRVPAVGARLTAGALAAGLAVGIAVSWSTLGSPRELALRGWHGVRASPVATDHNGRFLDLSSNGRLNLWHVGLDTFAEHPVAGLGGGTFGQAWLASPDGYFTSPEAHSVYVETLAELGVVGFGLLLVVVVPPVVAAVRARREPLVPFAAGAYAAWLVHAGVDWDWELLGVSGAALLVGVALVATARDRVTTLAPALRGVAVALALLLVTFSLASVGSSVRLASARDALADRDLERAVSDARASGRLAPWSIEGLELIAGVERDRGRMTAARRAYREIVSRDPHSWGAWAHLADVTRGAERRRASRMARALNPHQRSV